MVAKIDFRLAPKPAVALTARKALDPLAELLPPAKFEDVRLVVSELVTNKYPPRWAFAQRSDRAFSGGIKRVGARQGE
jgi:hypothetical protein